KWFDTNYHYLVPEFSRTQKFRYASTKLIDEVGEAKGLGINPKPVLLGPVTYLKLGKSMTDGLDRYEHLDAIVSVYAEVLQQLAGTVEWIQIDEPALVLDLSDDERTAYRRAFERLNKAAGTTKIILATYFDSLRENAELAASLGTAAIHVDLVRGPEQVKQVSPYLGEGQRLSLGLIDGRNIWRFDADAAWSTIEKARLELGSKRLMLGTSCSLLHVPIDLDSETQLDPEIKLWMAFAKQKCQELRLLADVANGQKDTTDLNDNRAVRKARRSSPRVSNPAVRKRMQGITEQMSRRTTPHAERKRRQGARLHLPILPTTTIGSFPQTAEVRKARRDFKASTIDRAAYTVAMESFIRDSVERQEELGLDVLVHGEAERNDMVEYFGEQLDGICFTENGWVQSYGSRCVKPPIIFGDVSRREPMTVAWAQYAQTLTTKPMKGMLTGPVTILCWSFVRDDQPRSETCKQIALAIRDEVQDLDRAGIAIIQVDEAALREGLPLRRADWARYLAWAVECFKLSTSGIRDETQLHTHMCYSEFNDIVEWIAKMDADVISVEASRSKMELLEAFQQFDYPNDIGPGIYDIHSPRVPSADEMTALLKQALEVIPADRLWVNPDCGLKTRGWPETMASLKNMVAVAKEARTRL
ncbi:MAG TPA: 5-methyltetrahydropteroyltriglutamate--homocysteine S-methyltransferase, partial [Pirellulales bacterium]|nr:5-methyltetrahydropteroyltriglutamate--homocysteine S-methyltransferase [Pirellulales bacterium]